MPTFWGLAAGCLVGMLVLPRGAFGGEPEREAGLRVMSFNVRYGTADDGPNHWRHRRSTLLETIRAYDPDLLGTQEVLADQVEELSAALTGHTRWGVGRDDGVQAGEFSALWFRSARFERLDGGTFWLSTSPDRPGSKSWDAALPRIASWVRLADRQAEGREFYWLNTHWDHRGEQARLESARLIRRWLAERRATGAVLVTGDFNAGEGSPPYRELTGGEPVLADTFRAAVPARGEEEGTYHGFGGGRGGERIDWILAGEAFRVREAAIDQGQRGGRYPSDHFPVTAGLVWGPGR